MEEARQELKALLFPTKQPMKHPTYKTYSREQLLELTEALYRNRERAEDKLNQIEFNLKATRITTILLFIFLILIIITK